MIFGVNTWFFQEYSVKEALQKISETGFSAAEVWMEHILKTDEDPVDIADYAHSLEMTLTLHSTSYDINLTSINEGIRKESLRQAELAVEIADKLKAEVLVIHPGRLSASRCSLETYWMDLEDAFKKINGWAERADLKVGIEAMEKKTNEVYILPDHVKRMLSRGWSNIGLTLDIAHTYTVMRPEDYIKQIDPEWIFHVHLSDGDENHTHLPLGKGKIDIDSALESLKEVYDGIVAIEGYVPGKGKEVTENDFSYLHTRGWMR